FSVFEKKHAPRFSTGQHHLGFFFTDNQEVAERYAFMWHRDVADSLDIDDEDVTDELLETENSKVDHFSYTVEATYSSVKIFDYNRLSGLSIIEEMQLDFNETEFIRFREMMVSEGHDLIEFKTADGFSEFVVLNAEQIDIIECRTLDVLPCGNVDYAGPSW